MNTDYYVYERFRKDDNTCFYVGQGRKKRYSTFTRNKLHDAIATKYGFYTIIYKDNLTQEQSCQLETERIKYYISCGYGINNKKQYDIDDTKFLTNTTYGGEKDFQTQENLILNIIFLPNKEWENIMINGKKKQYKDYLLKQEIKIQIIIMIP